MLLANRSSVCFALPTEEAVRTPALDADGFPVKPITEWSEGVPCTWRTSSFDQTDTTDGEPVTGVRWRILIEWDEWAMQAERLLLQGQELLVTEARPLQAVRKILFIAKPLCQSR